MKVTLSYHKGIKPALYGLSKMQSSVQSYEGGLLLQESILL
jgi:hypothetical protein